MTEQGRAGGKGYVGAAVFAAVATAAGLGLGESYIGRLSNHAGYFLVPVADKVAVPMPTRARHAVFIVVDGLRLSSAETMESARLLASQGQCRVSDQGSYTVSRPVYALLSTGLEVDRSGARNNARTTPLAAESVWEVARSSGLRVGGDSHLPWFRQLFPDGFDRFSVAQSHADDVFATPELVDVNLFHPLYVDDAGHRYGAASAEYAAAVARADREISRLLERIDFEQDVVVLTSDHGHRDEGGHGGGQPEIRNVLACFAGKNVARAEVGVRRPLDGRVTGPAFALLLGLRFPRHMRAGDDGLDALWEIADANAITAGDTDEDDAGAAYLADRHAAVARFRTENRAALERWLDDSPGTWARLYEEEARPQWLSLVVTLIAWAVVLGARLRAAETPRRVLETAGYVLFVALTLLLGHRLVLGVFDYTVVNRRERFIALASVIVLTSASVTVGAHLALLRSRRSLAADSLTVAGLLLVLNLGHILAYGWPLGFPLPPAAARYAPFFGSIALAGYGLVALGAVVTRERALRRTAPGLSQPSTDR